MIEFNDFKLTDLIDLNYLREIQEKFATATGMAAYITDADGKNIISESNITSFCTNMKKSVSISAKCKNCHKNLGFEAMSAGCGQMDRCHAGIYEIAAPIVVNGKFLGSFVAGQVMTEPVTDNSSAQFAIELGLTTGDYVSEISNLNVVPETQLKSYADLLYTMAELISSKAYNEYLTRLDGSDGNSLSDTAVLVAKLSEVEELVQ